MIEQLKRRRDRLEAQVRRGQVALQTGRRCPRYWAWHDELLRLEFIIYHLER